MTEPTFEWRQQIRSDTRRITSDLQHTLARLEALVTFIEGASHQALGAALAAQEVEELVGGAVERAVERARPSELEPAVVALRQQLSEAQAAFQRVVARTQSDDLEPMEAPTTARPGARPVLAWSNEKISL